MADKKIDNGATPVDWLAAIKWEPDNSVPTPPDDWEITKLVIEILDEVRGRLMVGAEGPGATLTADDCTTVLGCLKNPTFPNNRQPQDRVLKQQHSDEIALYCRDLVEKGEQLKNAVATTAKHFGCSTSKVYGARKALGWPYK
jgi:hypothetical protein